MQTQAARFGGREPTWIDETHRHELDTTRLEWQQGLASYLLPQHAQVTQVGVFNRLVAICTGVHRPLSVRRGELVHRVCVPCAVRGSRPE